MKYISKLLVLFAIVMMATACEDDINEVNVPLSVTTPTITNIKGTSVQVTTTAAGSHLISRGICYSTSPNPTIDDNKVTAFSKDISLTLTGLQPNTIYYARGFVQTSFDIVYSQEVSFTTTAAFAPPFAKGTSFVTSKVISALSFMALVPLILKVAVLLPA